MAISKPRIEFQSAKHDCAVINCSEFGDMERELIHRLIKKPSYHTDVLRINDVAVYLIIYQKSPKVLRNSSRKSLHIKAVVELNSERLLFTHRVRRKVISRLEKVARRVKASGLSLILHHEQCTTPIFRRLLFMGFKFFDSIGKAPGVHHFFKPLSRPQGSLNFWPPCGDSSSECQIQLRPREDSIDEFERA